jgi:hypothetical protein
MARLKKIFLTCPRILVLKITLTEPPVKTRI